VTAVLQVRPYQGVIAVSGLSNLADGIGPVALPPLVWKISGSAVVVALEVLGGLSLATNATITIGALVVSGVGSACRTAVIAVFAKFGEVQ
jgi:hypothetical protein